MLFKTKVLRLFRQFRSKGHTAIDSLYAARTVARFQENERFRTEIEETYDERLPDLFEIELLNQSMHGI